MVSSFSIKKVTLIVFAFVFLILSSKGWGGIAIVDVDDKSIEELGMWPWTRDIHGRLIDVLKQYGTKAIIFDIIFSEPDYRYPEKDQVLIDAVRKSQNIYFASVFYPLTEGKPRIIKRMNLIDRFKISYQKTLSEDIRYIKGALLPIEGLSVHAKGVGFVNVFPDEEVKSVQGKGMISIPQRGMVTQFPLLMMYRGKAYPSLPLLVTLDYLNLKLNAIRIKPDSYLQINNLRIPIDSKGDFKLRFSPPYTRFSHHSYVDVLNRKDNTLPRILKGALVIVSYNATGLSDFKVTPVSNYFPGSELIATTIDNIILLARKQVNEN
jgi:CHASE2 domain-containing sensor protein